MARILKQRTAGEPTPIQPRRRFASRNARKLMDPILSVRTLIKKDEAKGVTQPEFRATLGRAGVGTPQQAPRILRQKPVMPSNANASGTKSIATPRPAPGGIQNPKKRGRGT